MRQAKATELTLATIAVVLTEPSPLPRITDTDLRSLLRPPLSVGQLANGDASVSSSRDQIDVFFGANKIQVRELSGNDDFTSSKIPTVLHAFFGWYKTSLRSYGVNFVVTVSMADPEIWIRDNLLSAALTKRIGKELLRGTARISLRADPKTWNVQFAPNADGKLEINFNASEDTNEFPDVTRLQVELQGQYQGFRTLIGNLGL